MIDLLFLGALEIGRDGQPGACLLQAGRRPDGDGPNRGIT